MAGRPPPRDEALNSAAGPVLIPSKQDAIAPKGWSREEGVDLITPGLHAMILDRLTDYVNQEELRAFRVAITDWQCR